MLVNYKWATIIHFEFIFSLIFVYRLIRLALARLVCYWRCFYFSIVLLYMDIVECHIERYTWPTNNVHYIGYVFLVSFDIFLVECVTFKFSFPVFFCFCFISILRVVFFISTFSHYHLHATAELCTIQMVIQ